MKKTLLLLAFASCAMLTTDALAQCSSSKKHHARNVSYSNTSHRSIVDLASATDEFSTLVAALKAADLVDALSADGPFTVFAPDNAAFDRLPDGTVAGLLEPKAKSDLSNILTYHVVAGRLDSDDVTRALSATGSVTLTALNGKEFTVMKRGSSLFIKDGQGQLSKLTAFDVKGSNGVIHVIDTVILP